MEKILVLMDLLARVICSMLNTHNIYKYIMLYGTFKNNTLFFSAYIAYESTCASCVLLFLLRIYINH